ncbi:MAG: nucleoside deaminase [Myxococcales bacterium]|nr:nucleoside deaminase [Myxococcales bacterium]USN50019.1 MAG: nucleoside deaminase [Myxococcales bacterium]
MHEKFMKAAIEQAHYGMDHNYGGPFGAVIVKNEEIISTGSNRVTSTFDPTAHAEIVAIRQACSRLNDFSLRECQIYTSCEPCPMCLGAIYWSRIDSIYFAASREDAAKIGFDDHFFYEEIKKDLEKRKIPMNQLLQKDSVKVFDLWQQKANKTHY